MTRQSRMRRTLDEYARVIDRFWVDGSALDGYCKDAEERREGTKGFLETAEAEKHTTQKPHEALVREGADFARMTNYRCER